jgi:hypothetical protein
LKKEERTLLDAVRERAEQREEQEKKRKEREKRKPFAVPTGQNVVTLNLSPDGKYVIATISEPGAGSKNTIVPNYVTESAYTEDIPGRTKVGDTQNRTRLVVINVETGETKNVDHGQKLPAAAPPQRTELNTSVSTGSGSDRIDAQTKASTEPKPRDVQLSQLQWSDDGKNAVLMGRAADNKDRWVMLLDSREWKNEGARDGARRCLGGWTRRVHTRLAARQRARLLRIRARRLGASLFGFDQRRRAEATHFRPV